MEDREGIAARKELKGKQGDIMSDYEETRLLITALPRPSKREVEEEPEEPENVKSNKTSKKRKASSLSVVRAISFSFFFFFFFFFLLLDFCRRSDSVCL